MLAKLNSYVKRLFTIVAFFFNTPDSYGKPGCTDERFVAGSGSDFDEYLFRKDRANGRLSFQIDITRYYSNLMQFDGQGFQTDARDLIDKGLLPKQFRLTMCVYDVDQDSQSDGNGDDIADPGIDYINIINKQVLAGSGNPWLLGSGNNTWSTPSSLIPVEDNKFPTKPGDAVN